MRGLKRVSENVFPTFGMEIIFLKFEENRFIWKTFKPTKHEKIKHFMEGVLFVPYTIYILLDVVRYYYM